MQEDGGLGKQADQGVGRLGSGWGGTVEKEEGDGKMWQRPEAGGRKERGGGVGSWQGEFPVLQCFWRKALVQLNA